MRTLHLNFGKKQSNLNKTSLAGNILSWKCLATSAEFEVIQMITRISPFTHNTTTTNPQIISNNNGTTKPASSTSDLRMQWVRFPFFKRHTRPLLIHVLPAFVPKTCTTWLEDIICVRAGERAVGKRVVGKRVLGKRVLGKRVFGKVVGKRVCLPVEAFLDPTVLGIDVGGGALVLCWSAITKQNEIAFLCKKAH